MSNADMRQRMADNESVFRKYNEKMQQSINEIKRIAKEDSQHHLLEEYDQPLPFYCECSDENCTERVFLKPSAYDELHKTQNHFVIVPGHETREIEKVVRKEKAYATVQKTLRPSQNATILKTTPADNS